MGFKNFDGNFKGLSITCMETIFSLLMCQQNKFYSLNIAVLFHFRRNHLVGLRNGEDQKLRGTLW